MILGFSTVSFSHTKIKQRIYIFFSKLLLYRSLWTTDQPIATKMLLTGKKVKGKKRNCKKNHLQQPLAAACFPSNTFNLFLQGMFLHSKNFLRHIFNQLFYSKCLNSVHGQRFLIVIPLIQLCCCVFPCVCVTILTAAGEVLGDVFEVSRIRREDYEFHKGKSEYEDILQCNNLPSSATPRGHQTPAAFLIMTSGLDKVGTPYQNNLCKLT